MQMDERKVTVGEESETEVMRATLSCHGRDLFDKPLSLWYHIDGQMRFGAFSPTARRGF